MRRLIQALLASLSGLSAESAALILALGVTLGVFPIYGFPTLLCVVASLACGVNLAAIQLVNQLATPLQLALLLPFARLGARLVHAPHAQNWAAGLGASAVQAVAGWFSLAAPLGVALYFALVWILRRSSRQIFQGPPLPQAG